MFLVALHSLNLKLTDLARQEQGILCFLPSQSRDVHCCFALLLFDFNVTSVYWSQVLTLVDAECYQLSCFPSPHPQPACFKYYKSLYYKCLSFTQGTIKYYRHEAGAVVLNKLYNYYTLTLRIQFWL